MELFAKGKRGVVYLTTHRGRPAILKKKNPAATINTIKHEAEMLQFLNAFGIGPTFYAYVRGTLVREFIDGEEFADYLEKASKKEILRVLTEIFYQCRKMDLLGVNKLELTRPYKHILICRQTRTRKAGDVVQIDFERCKQTDKPKNVTQFAQCIARGKIQEMFKKHKINVNSQKILDLSKIYKQNYDLVVFEEIIRKIGGMIRKPKTFNEKVYDTCARVPEGRVIDYKGIARVIGSPAYQAIGQTLKRNPYAPRVPCHRVVRSDGSIGGFMGATKGKKVLEKVALLEQEGVHVKNGKIQDFQKVLAQ